ncbi:MAG: hypothetical protein ABI361_08290 [Nitrososphaera sp.]
MDPARLCQKIIAADQSIRYAALVSRMGRIVASELRSGLEPILTEQERESFAMKAVLGKMTMEDFAYKLGPLLYTAAIFKRVKRIEIPLGGADGEGLALLILSFDFSSDHEGIILRKILPLLAQGRG